MRKVQVSWTPGLPTGGLRDISVEAFDIMNGVLIDPSEMGKQSRLAPQLTREQRQCPRRNF